jgi:hypothetical protein
LHCHNLSLPTAADRRTPRLSPGVSRRSRRERRGHTYCGRAAIAWKADAAAKYQYTSDLLDCARKDGTTVVTSRLTGNFPGSPVTLRFFFGLEGDKIASLEIIP